VAISAELRSVHEKLLAVVERRERALRVALVVQSRIVKVAPA
jgi:hypothetical protein